MATDSPKPLAADAGDDSSSGHGNPCASNVEAISPVATRLWVADVTLLAVAVIWGVNIPIMKKALETGISPYALNAVRLVVSALVLQWFAWAEYRRGVRPSKSLQWWRVITYALVVSVAYQLLFLLAVSRTTSANVALIMATVPMWTALAARCFLKEVLPKIAWIGLIIAFSGTMIVTLQKQLPTPPEAMSSVQNVSDNVKAKSLSDDPAERVIGNVIALIAALAWAGGTVFSRPLLKTISPMQLSAFSTTVGLPFHMMIAGSTMAASLPLLKQVPLVMCILYSGILSTGLALAMWSYGVKHAGAAHAAMFQNLSPIVAIAAAWIWRGEPLSIAQTMGGAMIIGGLIIMRKSRSQ